MHKFQLFFIYFLIFTLFQESLCGEDFYQLLGVKRTATEQELKRSFKKLALKYHPDKNKENPEVAQKMFQKIANAYEILSDPEKRQIYDAKGEEGVKKHEAQQNAGQGGNFDDIFSQFFGGGGGGQGQYQFHFGGGGFNQHHQQEPTMLFENCDVFELNLSTLKNFFRRNEVWLILFYKPSQKESKDKKDVWKELSEKYYGVFKVAAVNCETDEELCEDEFQVYGLPKVLGFESKLDVEGKIFMGKHGFTIKALAKFAVKQMENFVNFVTEENYQEWIQREREKGKVLLFTKAKKTPPLFMALSKEFKNRLSFGEVRSPTEFQKKFNVSKIPTILVLNNPDQFIGTQFENEVKKDQLSKFLREFANERGKVYTKPFAGTVRQLTKQIVLEEKRCQQEDSDFCFIMIYDNYNYNNNKLIARKLAEQYKDDRINFFYVFHGDINISKVFPEMENGPGAVIVRGKRNKYQPFEQGAVEFQGIANFIDQVLGGMTVDKKMGESLASALKVVEATKNEL